MITAHLLISGMVQGVGFRNFVRSQACTLGVTGWVKNIPTGQVEALLQGEKTEVDKLIHLCRKGPFLAEVHDVTVSWQENSRFTTFEILT